MKMTRLEKALSLDTGGCSKMELTSCCCPHDFGIEDDSKFYKSGWECKALSLSDCEECWNKEIAEVEEL